MSRIAERCRFELRGTAPVLAALLIGACSAGGPAHKETPALGVSAPPAPGVYGPKNACNRTALKEPRDATVAMCVDWVTVADDGELTFGTSWRLSGLALGGVQKGPDAGNRNMYLVDDRGRRHDHYDTTLAAKVGGALSQEEPLEGAFLFRALSPGSSHFDFHDDDQGVVIPGILLEPTPRMVTAAARRLLMQTVLAATEVEIVESWNGMGPQSHSEWRLHGEADGFSGDAKIPAEAARLFLQTLAESPLLHDHYEPAIEHTDDYPSVSIAVGLGADRVTFHSESQGRGHVPWEARTGSEAFVVPSGHPARALESLRPYLGSNAGESVKGLR